MNKKVLTLCAAMLLSSSTISIYAEGVSMKDFDAYKEGVTFVESTKTLQFKENVTIDDYHNYLLIDQDDIIVDGQGNTLNGRIVITGNNVTVKNLRINHVNQIKSDGSDVSGVEGDWSLPINKNAITVIADKVTIVDNDITCSGLYALANGISVFPKTDEVAYVIKGNTIRNANAEKGEWSSTAIQITEGFAFSNVIDYSASGKSAQLDANFDAEKVMSDNTFVNAAIDYANADWTNNTTNGDTQLIQITPNKDKEGNILNNLAIASLLNCGDEAIVNFNGTSQEFMAAVQSYEDAGNTVDLKGKRVAIRCSEDRVNLLFGNIANPENGFIAQKSTEISADYIPAIWGDYAYFKQTELTAGNKTILVSHGTVVVAKKDANKNTYYTLAQYKPSDLNEGEINQYQFTVTLFDDPLTGSKELRLTNNLGEPVIVNVGGQKKYVLVDVTVTDVNKDGVLEYDGAKFLPNEFGLKAGDKYITFSNAQSDFVLVDKNYKAEKFGSATVGRAFMYAETLLKRYGEYFKLKLEYDKDGDNTYETDLTSIFAGELTPVKYTGYNAGNTWYELADKDAREFMLINEKNQILVVNTDPKTTWSSGNQIHAYKLELIDAKTYELDQTYNGGKGYYKANFAMEYKPSVAGMEGTTDIVAIYVDGREIGCYLDKQESILAATGNSGALKDIKITLNPSAHVKAESWLTSPVYYKVTVKNANKKAQHYGEVLGLDEDGLIAYVDPENVDQTMPEGQFAIEAVNGDFKFTNRENGQDNFVVRGSDFYVVDKAKNLFAYRDYRYNLMDTLEIAPISDYKNYDGFKRFTAEDLNNNTYTVSMMLLNGDSLNIIENHNDKHRIGLDEDNATEWRIEMPTVKLNDKVDDFLRLAADTVTKEVAIKYYAGGWKTTTIDAELAKNNKSYVYNENAALKICTYILKNTENNEYLYGKDWTESKGNAYYVCDDTKKNATRVAFKLDGENTVSLVPVYNYNWNYNWNADLDPIREDIYESYSAGLDLSNQKIIGGATSLTGVLKDVNLYEATTNDLFVISTASAPTYKKLTFGDKIAISRLANRDEVIYEKGEFAGINNRVAYKDINPTLFVDTAYVEREGNFKYQYLLTVNPTVNPAGKYCEEHDSYTCEHGVPFNAWTEGRYLVNMVDSAEANKDVHNNKFEYNDEYKLAFVNGYHRNDTLYVTNEAGEVTSKMSVGDANSNIAKFAFKMVDEINNEFVIETGTGYNNKYVNANGTYEVASREMKPAYLRWVNGNLVVTEDITKAEHFTMEASDKEATANENIAAGNVVVAGVNGAVVVKGAEGKNVIVSTILGKVVANEVVSSDNATIAAPQGVVVVSVDGESFKVVVK